MPRRKRREDSEKAPAGSRFRGNDAEGVSDASPGRQSVLSAIRALESQTDAIVSAAQRIGITISVS